MLSFSELSCLPYLELACKSYGESKNFEIAKHFRLECSKIKKSVAYMPAFGDLKSGDSLLRVTFASHINTTPRRP